LTRAREIEPRAEAYWGLGATEVITAGHCADAREHLTRARALAQQDGSVEDEADADLWNGILLEKLGQRESAAYMLNDACRLYEQIHQVMPQIENRANIAFTHYKMLKKGATPPDTTALIQRAPCEAKVQ
jgi:tetratricopeptide (TPR) repeat protein